MWFKDDRGKPALWMRMYKTRAKADVGLGQCRAAIKKLDESAECFVMKREPHIDYFAGADTYRVRCVVRWVPDEATARRRIHFEQSFEAECAVDGFKLER